MRLYPRSIRGRITLLTVLITALLLIPMALIMITVIQQAFSDLAWHDTREEVTAVAAVIRAGHLPSVVVPVVPGIDVVQVVGPDRHVIAASPAARGKPALSTIRPGPDDPIRDAQTCGDPEPGCMRFTALRVGATPNSPVIYAGLRAPSTQSAGFVTAAVAAQTAALIALVGWISWRVIGQTLRPVDTIRCELAQITFHDLSGRVPQPPGDDEVAKLARTANRTLSRLEHAVQVRRQLVTDASHELRTPWPGCACNWRRPRCTLRTPNCRNCSADCSATPADCSRSSPICCIWPASMPTQPSYESGWIWPIWSARS